MTIAAAQLLEAWSEVFSSPVITELAAGRVWKVTTERGDRYVLKKVSTFNAPDPVRRFTDEARIYMAFGVRWRLDDNQPTQPVDEATPFITRHPLTGYNAVSRLTRKENDELPALALLTALGLIDFFIREHDLVEESWLRTVHWIGDNFDALRLPASAFDGHEDLVK